MFNKAKAKDCNEFVTETAYDSTDSDNPYVGKFIPTVNLTQYGSDNEGPYFVFLQVNIIDPTFDPIKFNDSAQTYFKLVAYGSGKFFYEIMVADFVYVEFLI